MTMGYFMAFICGGVVGYGVAAVLTLNAINRLESELDVLLEAYEELEKGRDGDMWRIEN